MICRLRMVRVLGAPIGANLTAPNGNGVRPSSGAATLDGRKSLEYPEALEVPELLRPRTGALRLAKSAPVPAEAAAPPSFKLLRYDENYSYLRDPARRFDYLDAI